MTGLGGMNMPAIPEIGEELPLFFQALSQMKPGEDGAIVFAKALSGATPDSFDEALQRTSNLLFLFLREGQKLSARKARRICNGFETEARSEYRRLRTVGGATKTGIG
jgi:hypothetical protein